MNLKSLMQGLARGAGSARPVDGRGRRIVVAIECLLNQNARDAGAASFAAMSGDLVSLCQAHAVGILQMPCPEIACLGVARRRPPGQSLRDAMATENSRRGCARIAVEVADRIEAYEQAGCPVLAVLGGNPQSPGCAVHERDGTLLPQSGALMTALQAELRRRGLDIPFRGLRDAEAQSLKQDLCWLQDRLASAPRS